MRSPADDGFVLLETLVSISLIAVVMAAFTTFFVNSVAFTSQQRATQIAIQIANSTVEAIRALPASDLVNGHDPTSVKAQFAAASAAARPVAVRHDCGHGRRRAHRQWRYRSRADHRGDADAQQRRLQQSTPTSGPV